MHEPHVVFDVVEHGDAMNAPTPHEEQDKQAGELNVDEKVEFIMQAPQTVLLEGIHAELTKEPGEHKEQLVQFAAFVLVLYVTPSRQDEQSVSEFTLQSADR